MMGRKAPMRISEREQRRRAKRNANAILSSTPEEHKEHWDREFKKAKKMWYEGIMEDRPKTPEEYFERVKNSTSEMLPAVLAVQSVGIIDFHRQDAIRAALERREAVLNRVTYWKSRGGGIAVDNEMQRLREIEAEIGQVAGGGLLSGLRARKVIRAYDKARGKFSQTTYVEAMQRAHNEAIQSIIERKGRKRASDRAEPGTSQASV